MTSSLRRARALPFLVLTFAALLIVACGAPGPSTDEEGEPGGQEEPAASTPAKKPKNKKKKQQGQPEVFFANIESGGTYESPVEIVFEAENFDVVPVEDPPAVRPNEGHFHLAVDVDCVAATEIIPPGSPSYIHFGDGSNSISLQLEPGEHTLCLQMADGEHRVIAGPEASALTKRITINVVDEEQ